LHRIQKGRQRRQQDPEPPSRQLQNAPAALLSLQPVKSTLKAAGQDTGANNTGRTAQQQDPEGQHYTVTGSGRAGTAPHSYRIQTAAESIAWSESAQDPQQQDPEWTALHGGRDPEGIALHSYRIRNHLPNSCRMPLLPFYPFSR